MFRYELPLRTHNIFRRSKPAEERGKNPVESDDRLTQLPEASIYVKPVRERVNELWHGRAGRIVRYVAVFGAFFIAMLLFLLVIGNYSK